MLNQMILWLLLLFAVVGVSAVQKTCPSRSSIEQLLINAHIPGAVILVTNNSDILYEHSFGYRSLAPLRFMDPDKSIFALASVSKTLIAVAVMQLVERHIVDLDQDINQYLSNPHQRIYHPLYPATNITLRQLLSHSASINRNDQMESIFVKLGDAALTPTGLAEVCYTFLNRNASNWLPHPPGTVTLYSNIGSALAAFVVERVTQISYDDYVKDNILKPLGIDVSQAAFRLSDLTNTDDLVRHYTFNVSRLEFLQKTIPQLNLQQVDCSDWIAIPFYSTSFYPANLLRISARSLSIFLRMFMNNGSTFLQPSSIIAMRTVVSGVIPYDNVNSNSTLSLTEYGLIWNWRTVGDHRYLGHTGNMPGVANGIMINEKGTTAVMILSNGDSTLNDALRKTVYDALTDIQVTLIRCYES